jgi:flagellar biosynthesis chaperone FliJ
MKSNLTKAEVFELQCFNSDLEEKIEQLENELKEAKQTIEKYQQIVMDQETELVFLEFKRTDE